MSRNKKIAYSLFAIVGVIVFASLFLMFDNKAAANPSTVSNNRSNMGTSSASSTPTFMTPGTATSTLTLDAINGFATTTLTPLTSVGESNATAVDQAWLAVQITGSSSVSSFVDINWEYSQDGKDFYRDNATSTRLAYASTTARGVGGQSVGNLPQYKATGNLTNMIFVEVPKIPARYVRAVMTVPAGSLNSTNWAQYLTRQQR
jgi:hypothetical protein